MVEIEQLRKNFQEPEAADKFRKFVVMKRLDERIDGGWKILLTDEEKMNFSDVIAVVDTVSVEEAIAYDKDLVAKVYKKYGRTQE